MKKMLLVISLVLCLSAFSAAKDTFYNFTLDGFCDGMSLRLYTPGAPVPKILVGGLHVLGDCVNNFNVGGFKHGISPTVQYPGSTGAVLDVSDPLLGLFGIDASLQFLINTNFHTWTIYEGPDGVGNYLLNEGTYSNAAKPMTKGVGTKASVTR
jgi:hypothetical protein